MRVDELERELRAERPGPSQDFARRLDEWADAGFPRDRGLGPRVTEGKGPFARAWDRLTSTPPRRILLPVGAVATVAVVAGVAITSNTDNVSEPTAITAPAQTTTAQAQSSAEAAPEEQDASSAAGAAAGTAAPPAPGGDATLAPETQLTIPDAEKPFTGSGNGIARGEDQRIKDATARLRLGADADDVQDVANQVVDVTDRYHGVVLDSQVTTDQAGARASFQLELPYEQLDDALTDLSGLADVISRTEGSEDITARAVRARKNYADTLDQIRERRIALIRADTRQERLVIKSQINSLEATADAYETELNAVKRQGRFATVSVDVTSTAPSSGDDGNWGLDDAVDDAGNVLETIGGIALVSLAILLPLSLVGALIALAIGLGRRRSRNKALDT